MLEVQTKSGDASTKSSRRHQPILSIRARLIVLALLAIVPLMLERVHSLERARAERVELVRVQLIDLARGGESAQREILDSIRGLLRVIARAQEKMPSDTLDCNRSLTALTKSVPWIGGLGIAGTDGRLTCASDARALGLNISDRPHLQEALWSHEFVLSDYLINRVQQAPGLMAARPITHADGSLGGVFLASIKLEWIGEFARTVARRPGASVFVIDGSGSLIGGLQ